MANENTIQKMKDHITDHLLQIERRATDNIISMDDVDAERMKDATEIIKSCYAVASTLSMLEILHELKQTSSKHESHRKRKNGK